MAVTDAVMDYSNNGKYSTAAKAADVVAVWEANKGSAISVRHDHAWTGDTTTAGSTPLSGWDEGMWKMLPLTYCPYDSSYALPEWNPAHTMIKDIKKAFNLPNQGTDAQWHDNYYELGEQEFDAGQCSYFAYTSKDVASVPMKLSRPSMVSADTPPTGWPNGIPNGDINLKCSLVIGLQGHDLDVGVGRNMSHTVRPTDTNITTYNDHYKSLRDANTPAADYTDPPLSGTEHVVEGNIQLVNFENQWRPTTTNSDTDRIVICIGYSSHTFAQIKAIIDAAIA